MPRLRIFLTFPCMPGISGLIIFSLGKHERNRLAVFPPRAVKKPVHRFRRKLAENCKMLIEPLSALTQHATPLVRTRTQLFCLRHEVNAINRSFRPSLTLVTLVRLQLGSSAFKQCWLTLHQIQSLAFYPRLIEPLLRLILIFIRPKGQLTKQIWKENIQIFFCLNITLKLIRPLWGGKAWEINWYNWWRVPFFETQQSHPGAVPTQPAKYHPQCGVTPPIRKTQSA